MKITKRNKRIVPTFILMWVMLTVIVPGVLFCASGEEIELPESRSNCIGCHSLPNTMPGIYQAYLKSRHSKNSVTCFDCHGAQKSDPDAYRHHNEWISIIVSPNDCKKCHKKEVEEFNQSVHHNARDLVKEGCGSYILKNIQGAAGGTTACLRCHGSKIEVNKGVPQPGTWPNSGMARKNPDGSIGNCAACHESHEFSLAQARQPEGCAVCHTQGGGDPQIQAYDSSRHGRTYYAKMDQMNLDSNRWVVGLDYSAAPTCATCHMSATREMPETHNVNKRLNWNSLLENTKALAIRQKCGCEFLSDYEQPAVNPKHWENMRNVCMACHSMKFADNFQKQYYDEVSLFYNKWLVPGKKLYNLTRAVIESMYGEKNPVYTQPVDWVWFEICNTYAKFVHIGSAMMSPGIVQTGNSNTFNGWYANFIPAVEQVIKDAEKKEKKHKSTKLREAIKKLKDMYNKIANDPAYFGPWSDKKTEKEKKKCKEKEEK